MSKRVNPIEPKILKLRDGSTGMRSAKVFIWPGEGETRIDIEDLSVCPTRHVSFVVENHYCLKKLIDHLIEGLGRHPVYQVRGTEWLAKS